MKRGGDKPSGAIAGQLSIGIQGYDVPESREKIRVCGGYNITGVASSAKHAIELMDLAAFPFPAYPFPFHGVPLARSVKQIKAVGPGLAITYIQLFDPLYRDVQNLFILGHFLLRGIGKISQKREVNILIS